MDFVLLVTFQTGRPHKSLFYQGLLFQRTFAELSTLYEVSIEKTGTQSHNSLGAGEKYHGSLRNTYLMLRRDHRSVDEDIILALATKALNDTVRSFGQVPSALVFGYFSSLCSYFGANSPRSTLATREIIPQNARKLMRKHMEMAKIKIALYKKTPTAADAHISQVVRF